VRGSDPGRISVVTGPRHDGRQGLLIRPMTVAHLREPPATDYVEVMFCESARFYRLPRASPSFEASLRLLKEAAAAGRQLPIVLASVESDVIEAVGGS
jgi:hypothetical protein